MILLQFLEQLKFNKYEKDIILFLSEVNSATANQIYKNTKVPQGRIYSVLNELKNNSILEIMPTSPKKYKIGNIQISLKEYLKRKQEQIEQQIKEVRDVETKPQIILNEKEISTRILLGREEHLAFIVSMRESAKKELLQMAPTFGSTPKSDLSLERSLARGVKDKVIVKKITPENRHKIKICIKGGGEVRQLDSPDLLSLVIKDSSEFIVSVHRRGEEERTVIYSRNQPLLTALIKTFYDLWKKAKPISLRELK
jgi:HTH-type transcriptional regulator, sugar sensing transcriptional regulator